MVAVEPLHIIKTIHVKHHLLHTEITHRQRIFQLDIGHNRMPAQLSEIKITPVLGNAEQVMTINERA